MNNQLIFYYSDFSDMLLTPVAVLDCTCILLIYSDYNIRINLIFSLSDRTNRAYF
jgi:hypothetical protein